MIVEIEGVKIECDDRVVQLLLDVSVQRDALLQKVSEMREALIWCSGAADFQPGGQARKGWLAIVLPGASFTA